jgi:hypothetical protein
MKNNVSFFAVLFCALMMVGCKQKENYIPLQNNQANTKKIVHKIVVNETVDAGNYTYMNVDESGNTYWMAIPNSVVEIGKSYYYDNGMEMNDFESKELKRTFNSIIFSDGIRTSELLAAKQESPHAISDTTVVAVINIKQPKNGTSLEALFSKKESFSKKTIIVKGKVTKINNAILDMNWIHISDGSQFEGEKSLTVTTVDSVKVGDIVTFKGTVTLNKDFGHGYIYNILLEQSTIVD